MLATTRKTNAKYMLNKWVNNFKSNGHIKSYDSFEMGVCGGGV